MNKSYFANSIFTAGCSLALLCGCQDSPAGAKGEDPDPDRGRYHENVFSFDESRSKGLPKAATDKSTSFTASEYLSVMKAIQKKVGGADEKSNPAMKEDLGKSPIAENLASVKGGTSSNDYLEAMPQPLDYSCQVDMLALFNEYGAVRVDGELVVDKAILKDKYCVDLTETGDSAPLAKTADWTWWPSTTADHRVYPYKLIGQSWTNYNIIVYQSSGSQSNFHKYRSIWGNSRWWGLDADFIGAWASFWSCGNAYMYSGAPAEKVCAYQFDALSGSHGDDVAVARTFSAAGGVSYSFDPMTGQIGGVGPAKDKQYWVAPSLKDLNGLIGSHFVRHGSMHFYVETSVGMGGAQLLYWKYSNPPPEFAIQ